LKSEFAYNLQFYDLLIRNYRLYFLQIVRAALRNLRR